MDGECFDEFTKTLAAGASRRTVLRRLLGGATGGALALVGLGSAEAFRCRGAGQRCRSNADCCPRDNFLLCSPATRRCEPCATGTTFCPGSGQCVAACTGGQVLNPTTCTCACPPGTVTCGDICCDGACVGGIDPSGEMTFTCVP